MALLGRRNILTIRREAAPGYYLDGGPLGEILLPGRYIPPGSTPGGSVSVFIYRDYEDRLVATTENPYAAVGEFAFLQVVDVNSTGAFLDWGLQKDLLLPMRLQSKPVSTGDWLITYLLLDEKTDRIMASTRLDQWMGREPASYEEDQAVKLLIESETPLGFSAIINHAHRGLLYRNDVPDSLGVGQRLEGFVQTVRPDGKIDLRLSAVGYGRIAPLTIKVIEALQKKGGFLPLHDQSSPDEIREALGVSKKAFKQAVGALFRKKRISLEAGGIRLVG